jgi:hypothetical protein
MLASLMPDQPETRGFVALLELQPSRVGARSTLELHSSCCAIRAGPGGITCSSDGASPPFSGSRPPSWCK